MDTNLKIQELNGHLPLVCILINVVNDVSLSNWLK